MTFFHWQLIGSSLAAFGTAANEFRLIQFIGGGTRQRNCIYRRLIGGTVPLAEVFALTHS
jgi:hypothetical protein